jgi:Fe-S-cluster-containing dehydrogenase component
VLEPKKINGKLYMGFLPQASKNCNLCINRIKNNIAPFCVSICPTKALITLNESKILKILKEKNRYQILKFQ